MREYDGQVCYNAGDYNPGHETWIYGNICVVPMGSDGTPNEMVGHTGSACDGGAHGSLDGVEQLVLHSDGECHGRLRPRRGENRGHAAAV